MKPELLNADPDFVDDFLEEERDLYARHVADARQQIETLDVDAATAAYLMANIRKMLADDLGRVRREVQVIAGRRSDESVH